MTRTESLTDDIRRKISSGALAAGERLPSIRRYAALMQVSPSTVVEAYERLAAAGLIRSRRGAGFYVSSSQQPPRSLVESATRLPPEIDPFWVSRQSLDAGEEVLKPGCGWLPEDWMPAEALRKGLRQLARSDASLLVDYGGTRGAPALRQWLQNRFARDGLNVPLQQIMLTGSGSQALDLICRFLLRPGDTVLVDDPCYFNFQTQLRIHQVKIAGVPWTPTGPDITAFEQVLAAERPRLYITNSALHNPTGASLSPQTAWRMLRAAEAQDLIIVEDDIFADFEPEMSARLAIPDGLERVIRMGSFSKTLSASVRCGYIAARQPWIDGLVDLQIACNFGGPSPLTTELLASVLAGGSYRKHLDDVTRRLARAQREAVARLTRSGLTPWLIPRGGFYLWCRLPAGIDSTALARRCREENVILAPGNVFSVSQSAGNFLRFNVAHLSDPRVFQVLEQAMRELAAGNHL